MALDAHSPPPTLTPRHTQGRRFRNTPQHPLTAIVTAGRVGRQATRMLACPFCPGPPPTRVAISYLPQHRIVYHPAEVYPAYIKLAISFYKKEITEKRKAAVRRMAAVPPADEVPDTSSDDDDDDGDAHDDNGNADDDDAAAADPEGEDPPVDVEPDVVVGMSFLRD